MPATRLPHPPGVRSESVRLLNGSGQSFSRIAKDLGLSHVMASLGSRGDAYGKPAAQSFLETIRKALIYRKTFRTRNEAGLGIFAYFGSSFSSLPRHYTLGRASPEDCELVAVATAS